MAQTAWVSRKAGLQVVMIQRKMIKGLFLLFFLTGILLDFIFLVTFVYKRSMINQKKIGVSLSGGGHRATAFHLGPKETEGRGTLDYDDLAMARKVKTNLSRLAKKQIDCPVRHAENPTELQVKSYCPGLVEK
jgi:hypothetical protein